MDVAVLMLFHGIILLAQFPHRRQKLNIVAQGAVLMDKNLGAFFCP